MSNDNHVWVDVTELPSGFKPYPANTTFQVRPYSYRETKVISDEALSLNRRDQIIASGIQSSIPVEDISYLDFVYLSSLRVMMSTEDPKFKVKDELFSISDIQFSDVKVEQLPVEFKGLKLTIPTVSKATKSTFPALDAEEYTLFMFIDDTPEKVTAILNSWTYEDIHELLDFINKNLTYSYSVMYQGKEEKIDLSVLTPFSE